MDPLLAKKLITDIAEMRDFIAFIQAQAQRLNHIDEISHTLAYDELAIEVKARKHAYGILVSILDPLLSVDKRPLDTTRDDYTV
jgi:hypothetical protein